MINKTILQGRLVHDPELRHTESGIPVASLTVAWSEKYKETETQCFLPCVAWRNTGEFISKYFRKGQEIIVEGKLSTRKWVDKEGKNRSVLELTVEQAHFCGPKPSGSDTSNQPSGTPMETPGSDFTGLADDDELPF